MSNTPSNADAQDGYGGGASGGPGAARSVIELNERVVATLKTIRDPELPLSIYELGLVYNVDVSPDGDVTIRMTLTTPACPVAQSLPSEVEFKVGELEGVRSAKVELVWDPPWSRESLTDEARFALGLD